MQDDIFEESSELGGGGDSDNDCAEANDIDDAAEVADHFRMMAITDADANVNIVNNEKNMILIPTGLERANTEDLRVHCVPNDWVDPSPCIPEGEPPFNELDNPGDWSSFSFCPVFKREKDRGKVYKHHALPTGCVPVPKDENGTRQIGGWTFHYKGWSEIHLDSRVTASAVVEENSTDETEMESSCDGRNDKEKEPALETIITEEAIVKPSLGRYRSGASHCVRPRACHHWHKLHQKPDGWTD